ncbi:MAG: hypothetical protein QM763_05295 [Agriterribacter sp.]
MLYKFAYYIVVIAVLFALFALLPNFGHRSEDDPVANITSPKPTSIHIIVALCDNKYQGIVKVASALGDGQQPATNLYWGAAYGIKTFFSQKQSDWKLVYTQKSVSDTILERSIFKHKTKPAYLMADAYNGRYIKTAMESMLEYASGDKSISARIADQQVLFGGASDIIGYTGHDGLMDFSIDKAFKKKNNNVRNAIMLACYSKQYFTDHLKNTGATPLLWSTGLMAPEAYILYDALSARLNNKDESNVREAAAKAYATYQKCSVEAARRLLVTGW